MRKAKLLLASIFATSIAHGAWVFPLLPTNGILLKRSRTSFISLNFLTQIWAQSDGQVSQNTKSATNFAVRDARIGIEGQVNKYIQFGAFFDFADNNALGFDGSARTHQGTTQSSVLQDAYIGFTPSNAFNVTFGEFRDPFSRISLSGLYTLVIPSYYGYGIGPIDDVINQNTKIPALAFINPFFPLGYGSLPGIKGEPGVTSAFRDMGVSIWGNLAKGMFKYYAMVGQGKYDYQTSLSNPGNAYQTDNPNLKYSFRFVFVPTFLGFSSDPTYMMRDTYLGHKKTLQIGIGYETQKRECNGLPTSNCQVPNPKDPSTTVPVPASSVTSKAYDIDIFYENKFGNFVPQFQAGYIVNKDLGFGDKYGNKPEADGYYLQTQWLYDRFVGIGKPALAVRYESYTNKNVYAVAPNGTVYPNPNNISIAPKGSYQDGKIDNLSIYLNYYIANQSAKVSLGADFVNPNSVVKTAECINGNPAKGGCGKSFVDYTLQLQIVY
jgi:hypothetical protein